MSKANPKLVQAPDLNEIAAPDEGATMSIAEPTMSALDRCKATGDEDISNVGELPNSLAVRHISQAKDYVRVCADEAYTSDTYCFVVIPDLEEPVHLIEAKLAKRYLEANEIKPQKLALATMPGNKLFLCTVPVRFVANKWNADTLAAIEMSKTRWVRAISRKAEGMEGYKIRFAEDEDAFPEPKWPTQTIDQIIETAFTGRIISAADHPSLLRLRAKKPALK